MNPPHDPRLEALLDRQLQALPELPAPATLAPRIMAAIAAQHATSARGWLAWSPLHRSLALGGLALMFAALCLGGWQASHSSALANATQEVHGFMALLATLCGALEAVLGALLHAAKQIGPVWLAALAAVFVAGWISCIGLGTAFFRLAVRHR